MAPAKNKYYGSGRFNPQQNLSVFFFSYFHIFSRAPYIASVASSPYPPSSSSPYTPAPCAAPRRAPPSAGRLCSAGRTKPSPGRHEGRLVPRFCAFGSRLPRSPRQMSPSPHVAPAAPPIPRPAPALL